MRKAPVGEVKSTAFVLGRNNDVENMQYLVRYILFEQNQVVHHLMTAVFSSP